MASDQVSEQRAQSPDENVQQPALSPAMRRRLKSCFERGAQLAKLPQYDHDYANAMFTECLAHDPNNAEYIEAFFENLKKKYKNNKKGARIKSFPTKGAFKKAVTKKEWRDVIKFGLDGLKANPWDVPTLRAMAEACEALGYIEFELRLLKNARDAKPKDPDVNRHCALTLGRIKQFDQAIACWHRVEEVRRRDAEPPRMIAELTVAKARFQAGLTDDDAAIERARLQAQPDTKSKPQVKQPQMPQRRVIPLNPRQVLERAIVEDPTDIESYAKLCDVLLKEGRAADAKLVLDRASANAGDLLDREMIEDAQMRLARAQLAAAEQEAVVKKTEKAARLVKQRRETMIRLELEVFRRRCENHPEDGLVKYELGLRLKRAGDYGEAIKCLKEARTEPRRKAAATMEIGQCCAHLKQYKQALKCYEVTAELAEDDPELQQAALYRAGVVATGLNDLVRGEKHFAELLEMDPEYKDAQARLDKIRKIRENQ